MLLKRTFAMIVVAVAAMAGLVVPSSAASAAPNCNGYEPYSYAPGQNGDVIRGIGGCGSEAVTVEIWIDVTGPDVRAGCCPRGTSPVTAYAYCSRTGRGNYYTLTRTRVGNFESARRLLC